MLGDIGRIPIISLSGCISLSDILSELPLPQPLPKSVSGVELIDDLRLQHEAQIHLRSRDDWLIESISTALCATSTSGIILKNDLKTTPVDFHTLPPLLKESISRKPNILEENLSFQCIYSSKEVLQILSGEAGKCPSKIASPPKTHLATASHQNAVPLNAAPPKVISKPPQPTSPSNGGVYSVTSVEPLKLSIKRAPPTPAAPLSTPSHDGGKKTRCKRRSKGSTPSSSINQSWAVERGKMAEAAVPSVSSQTQPVRSPCVHQPVVPAPRLPPLTTSPRLQPILHPPPPLPPPAPKDPLCRSTNQMLNTMLTQLLQSDHESTIASLLSSSDGQSLGTPASVEPHHPRSPPLSVPSNCSYPATPCVNTNASVHNGNGNNNNLTTTDPSPINAIFDAADVGDVREAISAPVPPPPRGLAAYLQKTHNPEVVASPSEESVDAYARQHGSVPPMSTSPWAERRSGQQVAPSTVTAGNGGGAAYPTSSSLTNTPNGLERGGGKEKRGRRRRSELEELINWRVRDQPASSSGLFKKHQPPAQQALPILENSPLVSDNEGAAFFTEPLGERVKRRRQQHKTTPSFSNGGEVARTGGRGGGKSGGKKRHRDDTSSEISASPKRNSASGRHQHHGLTSSESDLPEDDDEEEEEEEEQKGKDDAGGASSSSCLTDSPVPRKQSLQRLVEEVKGRPPSLSKLEKLRHSEDTTSATSMPVSTEEVSPLLSAVTSNSRPLSSTERPRREASTRSSTSPPPLLALQACAPDPLSHAGRRQVKKHRQPTQSLSPLSSNEEEDGPVKKLPLSPVSTIPDRHSTKMKSDPHRRGDTSGTSARAPVKKSRSMVDKTHRVRAYLSSSSDSDKGSSVSFVKRRHNKPKPPPSEANLDSSPDSSASSNVGRVRTTRKNTPSTQPCTSSSAMDDDDENDELSALKAATRLPSPPPSVATTDLSDFDRTEEVLEAEKRKAEEVTKFAAAFTHFTAHITDLLRRVGGLDLLKIAGEMSSVPVDPGEDGEEFPDQTPVEARLSRRELNTLYQEADDVRVAGSMSNEPNGRLVRLLNLLLVNIRDAACLAAPNPTNSNFKELIQRRKARIQRRHGGVESASAGGSSECLSESLLWSHPAWLRVLRGLDAALIALHIVAGPDVPRARLLAMEDLVEAITAITHFHFNRLVTAIHAPADSKRSGSDISAGLTNLVRDSVGSRLSEALCGLVSLVRLHPGRFTDSLIMRLVDLALLVLSSALTFTGTRKSPTSSSSSSTTTPTTAAIVLFPDPAPPFIAGEGLEERQRRQTDYYTRNTWRLQMQRAALSLTATIFSQYDKHRQLIAAEVFSTMVPTPSKAYRPGQSTPTGAAKSLATVRNFWILASGSFTKGWKPFQIPTRNVTPAVPLSTPTSAFPLVANACFLLVHPFTALLLALIQSLIPAPSHLIGGRRSSSAGAPATPSSGVSQQSTTTGTGLSDQHGVNDSIQLAKEEKATTSAYFNATRTSMYLISELVKKAATKGEDDLRPLVDTVLVDLLRVAADSPIEWPVANFLLNAFGKVLTQILNGSTASVSSSSSTSRSRSPTQTSGSNASVRNPDVAMRLVAADNLITLAGGLRLMGKLRGSVEESSAPTDFDLAEAESALSAFLATPVLGLCHLTLGYDCESEAGERAVAERLASYTEQRDFAYQLISRLRYQHFDGLTLTSRRFHVIGCLYEVAQELAGDTSSDRRKHLEEARRSLLTEFAATHHSLSGMAPWLPPRRGTTTAGFGGGGSGGGRAGLISPTSSEPGFGEGPGGDVVLALYTGHGLGADGRRRKIAHAHRLATKLAAHFTNSPGFDFLFMHIVKLFYDPSIPLRARALKCLSSLLDIAPGCIPPPPLPSPLSTSVAVAKYGGPSDILSIIPVRLMDSSPAVREAAVELVGRLVTTPNSSSFLGPLYNPLVDRVLDLCVSVRKRAVKSLQTLLLCDSDGAKRASGLSTKQRSDSCIILLRRLNDEESVKKLVMETFLALWFTPLLSSGDDASKADARLRERVACVCEVVASFRNRGLQTVEEFMTAILNQESSEKSAQVDTACSEIVDFLIKIVHQCQANDWHEDAFKPTPNPPGASQHAKTCPLHPKHSRGRSDARCTCSSDSITTTGALSVLHLVAKCRPQLLLRHVPLLTRVIAFAAAVQDTGSGPESSALYFTTGIIEACCLHLASAGESQLSQLFPDGSDAFEDALIVLLQRHCRVVVDASLSCLSTIVNRLTKNYSRVTTCFAQFFECLTHERRASIDRLKKLASKHTPPVPTSSLLRLPPNVRPRVLRALYTVGLICKHFSLEDLATTAFDMINESNSGGRRTSVNLSVLTQQATCGTSNRDEVFNTLMFFAERALLLGKEEDARLILASGQPSNEDVELGKKAIAGLSFLTNRHDYLFCSARLQTFFTDILAGVSASFPPEAAADLQCIILDCLTNFLVDEEKQMLADDSEWATRRKQESLKELGDRREGHGSAVAQVYLPTVLEHCIISPSATVRAKTLSLISTVLRQGLVHPVHTIACLVCLQTDPEAPVRTRATQQLQEADKKFPGFLALKAEPGIRIGFRLQRLVASSSGKSGVVIRGATVSKSSSDKSDSNADSSVQARPLALNHTVYSLLQGNRQHRRSLITSLVTLFDLDHTQSPALYSGSGYPNLQPRSSSAGLASVPGAANAVATEVPHDNGLLELIYICDQLAHFPYKTLDEINYLAHSIDLRVSTLGSGVARALHDCMISSSQLKTPAAEAAVYDRKVTNLIEDAEAELFAKSTPPAESGPIERKVLDRMNRPAVADRRRAFRAQVIRSAPACLLLMSVRKYLEEAYDVTSSKLSSYSPGEEKQWQKPISAPSGRALQLGAFRRLVEIPAIVEQCATDPTWPPVTANLEETLSSPGEPSDKTILRLALLVHRQLLSMDDEGAIGTATATESCSQSTGPDGDALQAPPTVKKSSPAHRESEKSRTGENKPSTSASKLHNDQRAPAKAPTKVQPPPSKHRKIDDIDEANGSLSSLSDSSPVRKAPSSRQQSSVKSGEKRKQPHPSGGSSSSSNVSKSTKHPTKPNREAPSASLSKYHTSIPKKDPSKSGTKKRLHRVTEDDELSSLSSLDDSPPRPPKKTSPPPAPAPAPKKTEKPAVVRPKYDLAPLPGTPDIRTQQEQRRKMKALASKKAMTKHLAAGGSEKKLNRVSQQPPFVQKESFRRELKKPAEACESDVEISSVSSVSTVSTPSSSTCSSDS